MVVGKQAEILWLSSSSFAPFSCFGPCSALPPMPSRAPGSLRASSRCRCIAGPPLQGKPPEEQTQLLSDPCTQSSMLAKRMAARRSSVWRKTTLSERSPRTKIQRGKATLGLGKPNGTAHVYLTTTVPPQARTRAPKPRNPKS